MSFGAGAVSRRLARLCDREEELELLPVSSSRSRGSLCLFDLGLSPLAARRAALRSLRHWWSASSAGVRLRWSLGIDSDN